MGHVLSGINDKNIVTFTGGNAFATEVQIKYHQVAHDEHAFIQFTLHNLHLGQIND